MSERCCAEMGRHLDDWTCPVHHDRFSCPDALLAEAPNGRVGLLIHDGGTSAVLITHCPWCGTEVGR